MKAYFVVAALAVFSTNAFAQSGSLDASFGGNGIANGWVDVQTQFGAVVIQADEKILVVQRQQQGVGNYDIVIVRFHPNGLVDSTYGTNGSVVHATAPQSETPFDAALQSDGKLVVASTGSTIALLHRFNTDGSHDTGFGNGGVFTYSVTGATVTGFTSLKILSDQSIVACGNATISFGANALALKVKPDGIIDSTFGTNGATLVATPVIFGLDIQPDGKIVLAGRVNNIATLRLNANGVVDSTFGTNGLVEAYTGSTLSYANDVYVRSDGKIVAAGVLQTTDLFNDHFVSLLLNNDGTIDNAYGANGFAKDSTVGQYLTQPLRAILQTDNKLIQCGFAIPTSGADRGILLKQFTANGLVDNGFGTNGTSTVFADGMLEANALAFQTDGKLVAGGRVGVDSVLYLMAARFELEPTNVNAVPSDDLISIAPNPGNASITINVVDNATTTQRIKMYNAIGNEVMEINPSASGTVSVSHLPNGIYFLRLHDSSKTRFRTLVVSR